MNMAEHMRTWWIALNGDGHPSIWRPGEIPGRPQRLASRYAVDEALWAVLAAVLPDRGACARCTAEPCPDHATVSDCWVTVASTLTDIE